MCVACISGANQKPCLQSSCMFGPLTAVILQSIHTLLTCTEHVALFDKELLVADLGLCKWGWKTRDVFHSEAGSSEDVDSLAADDEASDVAGVAIVGVAMF